MHYKIAYHVGQRPTGLTRWLTGRLHIDDTGLCIDGLVPYHADFSEIQWLGIPGKEGLHYVSVGSSPPVFVTGIIYNWFGFILFTDPPQNRALFAELQQRVAGLVRCGACGSNVRVPALSCPHCAALDRIVRSRFWRRLLAACVLALLLFLYVGSYYHLSRRGMREAKKYNMTGFFYLPVTEVFESRDLSGHYFRMRLYAPLNWLDRTAFGGQGPVSSVMWGLSRTNRN